MLQFRYLLEIVYFNDYVVASVSYCTNLSLHSEDAAFGVDAFSRLLCLFDCITS